MKYFRVFFICLRNLFESRAGTNRIFFPFLRVFFFKFWSRLNEHTVLTRYRTVALPAYRLCECGPEIFLNFFLNLKFKITGGQQARTEDLRQGDGGLEGQI